MAYACKIPFSYVTIVPDEKEKSAGHLSYSSRHLRSERAQSVQTGFGGLRERDLLEKWVMVSMAGGAATARWTRRKHSADEHFGWSSGDWQNAGIVGMWGGNAEEEGAYLTWLWLRTQGTFRNREFWAPVKALASALLIEKRIGVRKVRKIISSAVIAYREKQTPIKAGSSLSYSGYLFPP